MSNPYKTSIWRRIRQWYNNNFVPYLAIQQGNEHFFVSRVLFGIIMDDLPRDQRRSVKLIFKKYWLEKECRYEYLMIVNPVLKEELEPETYAQIEAAVKEQEEFEESIKDLPRSKRNIAIMKRKDAERKNPNKAGIYMTELQYNLFGHIGFQGVQPTPSEIVYQYDLETKVMRKYGDPLDFNDRVDIRVKPIVYRPEVYGGRHAFVLTDNIIDRPLHVFTKTREQRRAELQNRKHAQARARGIQYRNAQLKK